jgi:hypothetical protein
MSAKPAHLVGATMVLFVSSILGGCIVSDQLTTLTIHPDGSADFVRFQSNIHSNEAGTKGEEELRRFVEEFEAGKDSDVVRIAESGGIIVESRWVSRDVPFSTLVVARMPTAAVLEKFCTFSGERGETLVAGRFTEDDRRRKLSLLISPSKVQEPSAPEIAASNSRQALANGFSEMRIAVTKGKIMDARGFTVASDKQSALLAPEEIDRLVRASRGQVELYLEWEVFAD